MSVKDKDFFFINSHKVKVGWWMSVFTESVRRTLQRVIFEYYKNPGTVLLLKLCKALPRSVYSIVRLQLSFCLLSILWDLYRYVWKWVGFTKVRSSCDRLYKDRETWSTEGDTTSCESVDGKAVRWKGRFEGVSLEKVRQSGRLRRIDIRKPGHFRVLCDNHISVAMSKQIRKKEVSSLLMTYILYKSIIKRDISVE